MKKSGLLAVIFSSVLGLSAALSVFAVCVVYSKRVYAEAGAAKEVYYCPMHPNFTSDKSGSCGICGMNLVKREAQPVKHQGAKKTIYYRNPMNPEVTSPVPMKDSMGMDYVPVYEEEAGAAGPGVYISPERQQMIGVKKEKVQKRKLNRQILTVGTVAYDPDLYVAQEEYLQALKAKESLAGSTISSVKSRGGSLVDAAKRKLLLMGMNEKEIEELAKRGSSQGNLYLPSGEEKAWVYITVYEYEMGLIREGLQVEIDALAYPGETFQGSIISIIPVLNSQTRSVQVRTEVADPARKLKPRMFVNAKIQVDLGEKLAVPEDAVLDTGTRKIVYLAREGDILEAREVNLGQKAQGFFEVLSGLDEGDSVITSGNFLVDSESKLKGAIEGSQH
jgi:membrane fusion protein, copper/silver efflux system